MKTLSVMGFIGGALFAIAAYAAAPEISVSRDAHPNMADAQRLARDAWTSLNGADQRNAPEAEKHLQRAKDLLVQVNDEIRAAADASNAAKKARHHH